MSLRLPIIMSLSWCCRACPFRSVNKNNINLSPYPPFASFTAVDFLQTKHNLTVSLLFHDKLKLKKKKICFISVIDRILQVDFVLHLKYSKKINITGIRLVPAIISISVKTWCSLLVLGETQVA